MEMKNRSNKKRFDRSYKAKRREFVNNEKLRRGNCVQCGLQVTIDNLVAFDFDHIDRTTKKRQISNLCSNQASFDAINAELAKCVLLCAICHRIKTIKNGDHLRLNDMAMHTNQLTLFQDSQ